MSISRLLDQVLIGACHMKTYTNHKAYGHVKLCAHTRNETRSPEKRVFLDSSHDPCGEGFTDSKDIAGLVVHAT